jgi:hypothetical protein
MVVPQIPNEALITPRKPREVGENTVALLIATSCSPRRFPKKAEPRSRELEKKTPLGVQTGGHP